MTLGPRVRRHLARPAPNGEMDTIVQITFPEQWRYRPPVGTARDVRAALAVLTPVRRQAIGLGHYGQFSQREIAERPHTPLGSIKARTVAAERRMLDLL